MKTRIIRSLVVKDLKKLIREPANLFLAILFPLIITVGFGLAFGSFRGGETQYTIGLVDLDNSEWSSYFEGNLSNSDFLIVTQYSDSELAQLDLEQGNLDAYIIIPDNFGESCDSYWANVSNPGSWTKSTIDIYVDQGSIIASNALPPTIQQNLLLTLYGEEALNAPQPVNIGVPALVESVQFSQFDFMVPGMFVFAVIFITMIVAEGFTIEKLEGLIARIQVTSTSSGDIIISNVIAFTIIAFIQVSIVFSVSGLMGFSFQTDITGIIFSFVMVLIFALTNIGFGLITATIAKNPGAATGISFVFIMPQMLLGTFMPVSSEIGQLVPAYYVTDALTSVLLRGASITSDAVIFDFVVTVFVSIFVIFVGIVLFSKKGKN